MSRHLHIICTGVPWPVDNSVAIDTFYTLEALHNQGIKIHLHYFCSLTNCHPTELNKYCESVHPYQSEIQRKDLPGPPCTGGDTMAMAISQDNYPVLFEGIECTGIIRQVATSNRKVVVRMYNDECRYCDHLAKSSGLFFQKISLKRRSRDIKTYEDSLPGNCLYAFSTQENAASFREDHQLAYVDYLPVFFPFRTVTSKTGIGNFCLYHGDLSDPCNERAALWLLSKVFNDISTPLIIAGKNPGKQIRKLAEFYAHSCLITDPSPAELEDLIEKAQIHVLPSFSNKRPELKLVHAMFSGRHCVVNDNAVMGTALEKGCYIGKNANAFKSIILQLYHRPFEEEEIELRKKIFKYRDKEQPEKKLINWLYS